jgi:hypothetical protein
MQRPRRKCLPAACLAYCAASLFTVAPADAAEYGFGDYGLGYGIPMSGYTPPPGVYFSDSFYIYSGSASKNLSFPFGRLTAIGVTANLITNIAAVAWYTDGKIFGGTLGFAAAIACGSDTNFAAVSFIGPLGFNRQLNRRKTVAAIGDTAYSASLGWEAGEHHWNAALTGIAPTGKYNPDSLAIMGLSRPALDIKGAYTFLSTATGTEGSAAAGMTFNLRNTATDYQSGTEFHVEGALNQHFPFGLAAGVGGYFYQQLSGDSGFGADLGPFRGRVAAVGPLLSYTLTVDKQSDPEQPLVS